MDAGPEGVGEDALGTDGTADPVGGTAVICGVDSTIGTIVVGVANEAGGVVGVPQSTRGGIAPAHVVVGGVVVAGGVHPDGRVAVDEPKFWANPSDQVSLTETVIDFVSAGAVTSVE